MIDRASFPVRFPIDNKYLSFDRRGLAKVRLGSIYFHLVTTPHSERARPHSQRERRLGVGHRRSMHIGYSKFRTASFSMSADL